MERAVNTETGAILVVDDEQPVRSFVKRLLDRHRYRCETAESAAEARTILRRHPVDLLICDIRMPGETGIELIVEVKSDYPDTAIIMLTGIADPKQAETVLDIGVYGYIIKPFDLNQVLISVSNALKLRALEQKAKAYRRDLEASVRERTAELTRLNDYLSSREIELEKKNHELEEINNALKVLLKRIEADKVHLEENVLANAKRRLLPYLDKLNRSGLMKDQRRYVQVIEANLEDLVSPLAGRLSSGYYDLTPAELQVADLIRQGKRTKEIAEMLHLSQNTVLTHRYKLRSKLNLKNKKTNLRSFLQNIR